MKLEEMINQVICADCIDILKQIPDNSVDLVLTDPPYGMTAINWDKKIDLDKLWLELKRIGKEKCAYVFTASQPFTTDLINSNRNWFKYEWIWLKNKPSNFQTARFNPLKCHENIIVFYSNLPIFNQLTLKSANIKTGRVGKGKNFNLKALANKDFISKFSGFNRSTIKINNPSGAGHEHPTKKPIRLIEHLVMIYSNKNDLILDPFLGSGTTAVACQNLKRNFIGIEKEDKYCEIARDRLRQQTLF